MWSNFINCKNKQHSHFASIEFQCGVSCIIGQQTGVAIEGIYKNTTLNQEGIKIFLFFLIFFLPFSSLPHLPSIGVNNIHWMCLRSNFMIKYTIQLPTTSNLNGWARFKHSTFNSRTISKFRIFLYILYIQLCNIDKLFELIHTEVAIECQRLLRKKKPVRNSGLH